MRKNLKKVWRLAFTMLLASIIAIIAVSPSTNTSDQSLKSVQIIVEDNSLNYTSNLLSFPQQLMNLSKQVKPRAFVEYSIKMFKEDFYISTRLLNLTGLAQPRIPIEYSTLLFTTSLVQPAGILPWIITCNETGQEKDVFDLSENVYVLGGNLPSETNATVYIIPGNTSASPDNAVATFWTLTGSNGELPLTLAWDSPLTEGDYDIWVDLNQNGIYDETIDIYDYLALDTCAFTVIPEFPSFLILPLFLIATILTVIVHRRKQQT